MISCLKQLKNLNCDMKKQRLHWINSTKEVERFTRQATEFFKKAREDSYRRIAIPKEIFDTGSLPKSAF